VNSEDIINSKYDRHRKICEELNQTYIDKNKAYGNSFGKQFQKYGITSALVRMGDKWERFESLAQGAENNVRDESIFDTLLDIANYAIMTVMELEDQRGGLQRES